MNSYSWEEHTADVRLVLQGQHVEDLFHQGIRAIYDFMQPEATKQVAQIVNLDIKGRDRTHLLVDFLSSVITWSAVHKAEYNILKIHELSDTHLVAILEGYSVNKFGKDIKAATHHEATIQRIHGGFQALIVFDI